MFQNHSSILSIVSCCCKQLRSSFNILLLLKVKLVVFLVFLLVNILSYEFIEINFYFKAFIVIGFIMSIKELLAIDKLIRFKDIVRHNGGVIASIKKLYR